MRKLRSSAGTLLVIVLLAIAVAAAFVLIIAVPGYINHLNNSKITMDAQSVVTAKYVAEVTYLQDQETGLKVYYYDELTHTCLDKKQIGLITPYGRSSKELNAHQETGAVGIPNLGGDDGAQILCVIVEEGYDTVARWCGKSMTYEDYNNMSQRERALLTSADYAEMDKNEKLKQSEETGEK